MELNWLFGLTESTSTPGKTSAMVEQLIHQIASGAATINEYGELSLYGPILESVIATDDRVRVPDTKEYPWRKICCLTILGGNGAIARGTGWFVGPQTLLTAGHCVYSTVLFDGWAKEIIVEPARDYDLLPFGRASSSWFSALLDWVETENPNSDIGCIQLEAPLGNSTGWFKVDTTFDDVPEPTLLTIAGYPVDRDNGKVMYLNRSSLLRSTATQLFYDVDTMGGQSGAPILVIDSDGCTKAVGIHAYGASGKIDPVLKVEANSGRRFTSDLLITIAGWLNVNR